MTDEFMVSIICTAYNHEDYIADAIESFLMQKTNFKFEILIHDDASTDRTAEIIKEYEIKFPNLIKPIYQIENQYSKGNNSDFLNRKRARGKYVAICEGDDYWTDEYKLQKQLDYMEGNSGCTFCFHNAYVEDQRNPNKNRLVVPWMPENRSYFTNKNRKYSAGELQLLGFIPTMSFFYPRRVLDNPPDWFFQAPVGDNPMKLIAASYGYAYYMNETMSVYRFGVPNSATTKWREDNSNKALQLCNGFIKMLNDFNEYSNFRYTSDIELSKLTWEIQKLSLLGDNKELKNKRFKEYINLMSGTHKMKTYLRIYFPWVFILCRKLNRIFSNY